MLTSIAILITSEYISKLKLRYAKLGDWINVFTLLHGKTLKQPMVDNRIDDQETNEWKTYISFVWTKEVKC